MAAESSKILNSKFVKAFYNTDNEKVLIAFEPTLLIKSSTLKRYLDTISILDDEQRTLIDHVFGDEGIPKIELTDEEFLNQQCTFDMCISSTGKEERERPFYIVPTTNKKKSTSKTQIANFIYLENQVFHGMYANKFSNNIYSSGFNRELNTFDKELLDEILRIADSKEWMDVIFKSEKLTLSKVLISLLPNLPTATLTALTDFINSEILSTTSGEDKYADVHELKGDTITYFYNSKNYRYQNDGNLGASCMRGDGQTEQVKFYANNPTNVSLLTYIKDKKLLARTVLWTAVDGKKYCDRIYCSMTQYGTLLAAYCKGKEYKTVYSGSSNEYGIEYDRNCVVKLDSYELKNNNYPYLDSMYYIDILNKHICPEQSPLCSYLAEKGINYLVKSIQRSGPMGRVPEGGDVYLQIGESSHLKYLKDGQGNQVTGHLNRYAIIRKPIVSIVPKETIITINDMDRVDYRWCENTLIDRYNSIRPTLLCKGKGVQKIGTVYLIRFYDKQFIVFSQYHKIHIRKQDAVFVKQVNSYVLKNVIEGDEFQHYLKFNRYRKIYAGKLIKISSEGLENIRNQINLLPFHESLIDIRKSRVYNVKVENIFENGIKIKGFIVPYKYIRFVRNESRKNQK
jgi:hypothetical protein